MTTADRPIRYCGQVILGTLKDEQGIRAAHLNTRDNTITLDYDGQKLETGKASHLLKELKSQLRENYEQCGFRADGMYCNECLARFEGKQIAASAIIPTAEITTADGVLSVSVDASADTGSTRHATQRLDHTVESAEGLRAWLTGEKIEPVLVGVTLLALVAGVIVQSVGTAAWLVTTLAVIAYAAGGYFGLMAGLKSLRELEINVDLLMLLAAGGAALIGSWPEGATLLFLFSLSNVLQNYALERSRNAIRSLLDLRPATALARRDGREVEVLVEMLEPGETVIIKPGDRIPVDGVVVKGTSAVDQASITGESMPVEVEIGDQVFAGTVNQQGALEAQVTKRAEDTTLAKIIRLVEEAQDERAPTQRFLDKFEQYYAMVVVGAVALFIAIPTLLLGQPFEPTFYKGMVLLVVASPCALVISTPASILSAIATAARQGILFKGGAHLENAAMLKVIALDKTGTITTGQPRVTDLVAVNGYSEDELLALSASIEALSEHPLAQAVVSEAKERRLDLQPVEDFQSHAGMGVHGLIDGISISVGSRKFMGHQSIAVDPAMEATISELEHAGNTVLLVHNDHCVGAIAVADRVRPEAKAAIAKLRQAGVERVAMLTGDNERVAAAIAAEVGIDEYHAGLMPADKVTRLQELREKYGAIAMVGDGVNDAPALAAASIGIAMGAAGTDVALETADVVLMADELSKLAYVIELSKKSRRIVWENIAFSLAVIVALILGTFGLFGPTLPLPLGVVGHEGSTVLVVFNGLRLLAFRE